MEGDIGAPKFSLANSSVPLTYFQATAYKLSFTNRKQNYFKGKTTTTLKIDGPKPYSNSSLFPDPFSLSITHYL
jgi:hypothetical protein